MFNDDMSSSAKEYGDNSSDEEKQQQEEQAQAKPHHQEQQKAQKEELLTKEGLPLVGLDEIKRFELFRSVIQHEDDLLNQRVSWIILAQSFLMAAFITSSGPNSLRLVTAYVGLATVIVTMPAIIAAGQNIEIQQVVYFKLLESDARCMELHGHTRDSSVKANEEHRLRTSCGHILPTMAFRGRGSLRILTTVILLATVQCLGWIFLLLSLRFEW